MQFTDQFSIVNTRNFNKMIFDQGSILDKLKEMR